MATTTTTTRCLYKFYDLFGQKRNDDAQCNNNTENILNYTYRGCLLQLLLVFDFLADHYVLLCDLPSSLIVQYCNT